MQLHHRFSNLFLMASLVDAVVNARSVYSRLQRKRQLLADLLEVLIELPAKLQSAIDNFFCYFIDTLLKIN